MARDRVRGLAAVLPLALLLVTAPAPATAARSLRTPALATDPFAPVVAAAALGAWVLTGWLLLVATTTVAARLPGLAGQLSAAVARRVAPAAVRRTVEVALGLTVAVGTLAAVAAPAQASGSAGGRPPAAPGFDWPTASGAPALDWPDPAAVPPPASSSPGPVPQQAVPTAVVVAPGDTLWAIAADHLPPSAAPAQVAQAWPRWWSANRDAIGPDPDLIHPGTQLTPPA